MTRLRGTSSLAVLLTLAVACAPTPPATQPSGGAAPTGPRLADTQTLTLAFPNVPANMDPHTNIGGTVRKFDIFETLVILDDNGKDIKPLLATKWDLVDPTTWRFTLRRDAKFHDNTPLTAKDVEFSWARVTTPGFRSQVPGNAPSVASMTAIDDYTVEVKTKTPSPLLLRHVEQLPIVPKAYIERVGVEEFTAKPIGSGPFKFKEFRAEDRAVVTGWMEHAYRKPTLTEITIRAIPDQATRSTGLSLNEVDVSLVLGFDSAAKLQRDGLQVASQSSAVIGMLLDGVGGNGVDPGPIADKRVRQALSYGVDRDALSKGIYLGFGEPAGYLIREQVYGYNPDVKPYTLDVAKAKSLLAAAGYPNGFTVDLEFSAASSAINSTAIFFQDQMKNNLSITVNLKPVDSATFVSKIYKRSAIAPLYLGGQGGGTDADTSLVWYWSENPSFGKRYNNPEFDRIYLESTREIDPAKRLKLLQQALAIIQDDPPWLGMVTNTSVAAWNKSVTGLNPRSFENDYPLLDPIKRIK